MSWLTGDLPRIEQRLDRGIHRPHAERSARIVDQAVQGTERGEFVTHAVDVGLLREVGGDGADAGAVGQLGQPVGAACDADDLPAVLREQPCRGRPDPRTRPRDHHALRHGSQAIQSGR